MRLGPVAFTRQAILDFGRACLWLSQPGAGRNAAARVDALARAVHEIAQAPRRWPSHGSPGMRERAVRGGYLVVYRIVERIEDEADDSPDGPVEIEIVRVLGPGQQRGMRTPDRDDPG